MARNTLAVGDLVERIAGIPADSQAVLELLQETSVDIGSLSRYAHFCKDTYTRNLIFRDERYEIMALCWQPGQRTVIHTHNGQLGWMSVERGALAVINYKWTGCNAAHNQNIGGLDCLAGATELSLDRLAVQECFPQGPVNTVDRVQTIHQVVVQGKEPVVSIHVYSKPIDSCVAFDLEARRCYRRTLRFHSEYGDVVAREGDLHHEPTVPSIG